jgi:hypothetical protein
LFWGTPGRLLQIATSNGMQLLSTPLLVGLVVLVALAIVAGLFRMLVGAPRARKVTIAYEPVPTLLTPAERSFFGVLQKALASDYQVFVKVRLADIVRPARNPSRSGWQSAFNRITSKHVDFVLCDLASLSVVGVIELDDRTHEKFERGVRDGLVDSALSDAGIPVLRVPASKSYSPARLREQVENLFRSRRTVESTN